MESELIRSVNRMEKARNSIRPGVIVTSFVGPDSERDMMRMECNLPFEYIVTRVYKHHFETRHRGRARTKRYWTFADVVTGAVRVRGVYGTF